METSRIHNVFAQQYGFTNFGRVFTVIHCETLSWVDTNKMKFYIHIYTLAVIASATTPSYIA